jgi:ribonuclease BN (tRNA processing enzyme)
MMKFKVLGCYGSSEAGHRLTSFLINDEILLDAGDGVSTLTFKEQSMITKIIISHAHLDHICSLPFLALNLLEAGSNPVDIITPALVIKTIKSHIMNNEVWPDFSTIPRERPVFNYKEISDGKEIDVGGVHITPIHVDHIIPCYGYIIRCKNDTIIYSGDTSDVSGIFEIANKIENLRAIVIEMTFSSDYQLLADESKHMTPTSLAKQFVNLKTDTKLYLYHMKSNQLNKIVDECKKIGGNLELLQQGNTYHFDDIIQR